MIGIKIKRQTIKIITILFLISLSISCGLWPSGPETTIKYFTFTFTVESDSCLYSSDAPTSYGKITKHESPFVLELKTIAESPGSMFVTNYSETSNVYVNFKKKEGNRSVDKDYIVKPNEQISIQMDQ